MKKKKPKKKKKKKKEVKVMNKIVKYSKLITT